MNPLVNMLAKMMMSNPRFQNETCQSAWRAFQNNDMQSLENIANNLCQQNGVKLEDAVSQTRQRLHL